MVSLAGEDNFGVLNSVPIASSSWKGVLKSKDGFLCGAAFLLDDGRRIRFGLMDDLVIFPTLIYFLVYFKLL